MRSSPTQPALGTEARDHDTRDGVGSTDRQLDPSGTAVYLTSALGLSSPMRARKVSGIGRLTPPLDVSESETLVSDNFGPHQLHLLGPYLLSGSTFLVEEMSQSANILQVIMNIFENKDERKTDPSAFAKYGIRLLLYHSRWDDRFALCNPRTSSIRGNSHEAVQKA